MLQKKGVGTHMSLSKGCAHLTTMHTHWNASAHVNRNRYLNVHGVHNSAKLALSVGERDVRVYTAAYSLP